MSQVESSNPYQPPKSDPVDPSVAPDDPVLKSPWLCGWATIFWIVLLLLINFARCFQPPDLGWDDSLKTAEIVASIGAFVTYLLWIYRSAANVRVIDRGSTTSPGWAAGCHFIPFVNWVAPCLVLRDVARGTFKHRPLRGMDTVVILWWIALLLRSILVRPDSVPIFLTWALASVVACFAIIYIIVRVCRGQAEFRWSDVPGADRPVMVPLGSRRAAIPGAQSDGHPLPPPRRPLPPRRPSISMAAEQSPEGIPSPEIPIEPGPFPNSPGPPGPA